MPLKIPLLSHTSKGFCVICREELTAANDSTEHVIPNAIGGRLRVRGFICEVCNNEAGSGWDAALATQLQALSLLFAIERDRGQTPAMPITTTAGETFVIKSGGRLTLVKPIFAEKATSQGVEIAIEARDVREARKMLRGVKRKYPTLDIEATMSMAKPDSRYPRGFVHHQLEIGGPSAGRSIVKTALAYAHLCGLVDHHGDAPRYLRDTNAEPCFGYYYERDLVLGRPSGTPFHCVAVSADPNTGLVLSYVEYFGVYRMIVCISRTYRGPPIMKAYAVDPRTGGSLDLRVSLLFNAADLTRVYQYETASSSNLVAAFEAVLPEAIKRNAERSQQRVLRSAWDYAWANCGAMTGEILTEDHIKRLSALFVEGIMPLIARRSYPTDRPDKEGIAKDN